jgi:hypothetical protein
VISWPQDGIIKKRERAGDFRVVSRNRPEGQGMDQQIQGWRSASGQRAWLSMLIDAMEAVSRPELRAVPCDDQLLAALRVQLARPALVRTPYGSAYCLRN